MNKVILIGNLGQDPEKRVTGSSQTVTHFNIATTDRWTDKSGQKQERTEWHRIVVWGPQGENCAQYLAKGRQVCVEGRLQTRDWNDKEGNKRTTTEIVADRVHFLGGPRGEGASRDVSAAGSVNTKKSSADETGADDVPF